MSSSIAYCRATPSVHRRLVINRIEKRYPVQVRTLWWWGRQGSWSSANEDALEERMQRHQKILRYRYSRALRRRSMWDRDNSPSSWSWRGPSRLLGRRWTCKPLSTSEYMQARLKEDETGIPSHDRPWDNHQRNFEIFKAEVDKAIEKDPFGVLFGKRLRGYSTTEKSPWSSFSSLFSSPPAESENDACSRTSGSAKRIKIDNLDEVKPKPEAPSRNTASKPGATSAQQLPTRAEYVYDPVSGRNVLKTVSEADVVTQPSKPFLEALFSEHCAEEKPSKPSVTKPKLPGSISEPQRFESSRSREYQQLRAATIGTSIDTTVAFSAQPKSDHNIDLPRKQTRTYAEPDQDAPLFYGTTYAGRQEFQMPKKEAEVERNSSWLQREGFRQDKPSATSAVNAVNSSGMTKNRLESALDRVQSSEQPVIKTPSTKLQPAMDRMSTRKINEAPIKRSAPLNILVTKETLNLKRTDNDTNQDKREDLDLLRASDVRAATKTARITKQDIDLAKSDARSKLETDFSNRQKAAEATSDVEAARATVRSVKRSTSMDSVRKHMLRYPDGVVAKTMRSIGLFSDNFKKYELPGKSHIDLTGKIESTQEALDKLPSIFKQEAKPISAMKTVPSPEAEQIEKSKAEMTRAIATAKQKAIEQWQNESLQVQQLANSIRETFDLSNPTAITQYKEHTGVVCKETNQEAVNKKTQIVVHPLHTATVKPGVKRYPDFEYHTHVFEPKLIAIREGMKAARQNLTSINAKMEELKASVTSSNRAVQLPGKEHESNITTSVTSTPNTNSGQSNAQTVESILIKEEKTKEPQAEASASVSGRVLDPVADKAPMAFTSPYVILTYNKRTGDVDLTQLSSLMGTSTTSEKIDPIAVMGNLNYPAAFVSHFVELEKAGYQLSSGGGDLLIFQKRDHRSEVEAVKAEALDHIKLIRSDISELRNRIAEEEAQSQPLSSVSAASSKSKQAATVLDELPSEAPTPGPAAPTAPTTFWHDKKKNNNKKGPKVKRQEQVFSGTIRSTNGAPPNGSSSAPKRRRGSIYRFFRTLTAIINTVVAVGVVTYVIGVVAEAKSVHAQQESGVIEGNDIGPRKKVVMPAGRPGIYSTESTRD